MEKLNQEGEVMYMTVYFDTNGVGRLMGENSFFNSEEDARLKISTIESQLTKEHKVDYRIIPYRKGQRDRVMKENNIVG